MKHNEHVMAWLTSLRDEASRPECGLGRSVQIIGILVRYSYGTSSV